MLCKVDRVLPGLYCCARLAVLCQVDSCVPGQYCQVSGVVPG